MAGAVQQRPTDLLRPLRTVQQRPTDLRRTSLQVTLTRAQTIQHFWISSAPALN
jgi:hypothetical protein